MGRHRVILRDPHRAEPHPPILDRPRDRALILAQVCAAVLDIDEDTGRARNIERLNLSHNQ